MSNSTESSHDPNAQEHPTQHAGEQEHAGNSGEGAASALAHLKTQTKQHRRLNGDEEAAGGQ